MKRFFDERTRKSLIAMLSLGMSRRAAADSLGCHVATIYNEAARDRKFYDALLEAEAGFEIRHRKRIEDASKEIAYWRASAWAISQRQKSCATRAATREEIDRILAEFAKVLANEVPDKRARNRMLNKLCRAMGVTRKPTTSRKERNHASPNRR